MLLPADDSVLDNMQNNAILVNLDESRVQNDDTKLFAALGMPLAFLATLWGYAKSICKAKKVTDLFANISTFSVKWPLWVRFKMGNFQYSKIRSSESPKSAESG